MKYKAPTVLFRIIYIHKSDGYFWFRLFGYGLHFKNTRKHDLLFSERYGYTKFLKVGKWNIKTLKPS